MQTKLKVVFLLFLILTIISTVNAEDNSTIHKITSCDDFNDVQHQINNAKDKSTVYLNNKTYSGNTPININKEITLDGSNNDVGMSTLDGKSITNIISVANGWSITLKNIIFINGNNYAGGALFVSGDITLKNCIFINNYAENIGGAIFIDGNLITHNCQFKSNTAGETGGAIFITGNITCRNTLFDSNIANTHGGGVVGENLTLNNCTLKNNKALELYGGGVYAENTILTNTKFENNYAKTAGGGAITAKTTIENCDFINNKAEEGAALYLENKNNIVNSTFINNIVDNKSTVYGEKDVNIVNSIFINNNNYNVYSKSKLNVDGNWWGKNTPTGIEELPKTWIILTITAEENKIILQFKNNDLTNYTGKLRNLNYKLLGSISPNSGVIENTIISTLTPQIGLNTVIGIVNNESVKVEIIKKQNSTITLKTNSPVIINEILILTATANTNGNITFYRNEEIIGKNITTNHIAKLNIKYPIGHYDNIYAIFEENTYYFESKSNIINFEVLKIPTKLDIHLNINESNVYGKISTTTNSSDNITVYLNNEEIKINQNLEFNLKDLKSDLYKITANYTGNNLYNSTTTTIDFIIGHKIHLVSENITSYFQNGTKLKIYLLNSTEPLSNEKISINLNGETYTRTINSAGFCELNINLAPGKYIAEISYDNIGLNVTITVLPVIIGENVTKYFQNQTQYTTKILNNTGKPNNNQKITLNINGLIYTRTTNNQGEAKLDINLPPGTYIITVQYKNATTSNLITVLSTIKSENITMTLENRIPFIVTALNNNGMPIVGKYLEFNINGIIYNRTSDTDGQAKLNINLIAGEYIITTTYDNLTISNTITIKSL